MLHRILILVPILLNACSLGAGLTSLWGPDELVVPPSGAVQSKTDKPTNASLVEFVSHDSPGARQPVFLVSKRKAQSVAREKVLPRPVFPVTPEVKQEMRRYLGDDRSFIEHSLKKREQYHLNFKEIFQNHGIPEELINVAMIESAFNERARSRHGAVGIWQFMKSTAKIYGLRVGARNDERRDPHKATIAAAQHIRDLYETFGDWYLALAAYNSGAGRVSRDLEKTGGNDFWTLARKGSLSSETQSFVPKFIAVSLILKDLKGYGFTQIAQVGTQPESEIG